MTHYPSAAIANAFLERAAHEGRPLTHLKLQKLVYFADGLAAAALGTGISDDKPEAWPYGPVYPRLYQQFKDYGASSIPPNARAGYLVKDERGALETRHFPEPGDHDARAIIDHVWDTFKDTTAIDLSAMSHDQGGPWELVWSSVGRGGVISDERLHEYFRSWVDESADA